MGLLNNFISLIVATTTAFTAGYADMNIKDAPDEAYTYAVRNVEQANSVSQGSGFTSGIVVVDRAKGNAMETNGALSHQQLPLQTLAKLPILLYAVRVDPDVFQEVDKDPISMVQGFSAEATNRLWEKYGGVNILQDLSQRYNLQETTAKATWGESTMSAVDMARLLRRFMDDKKVSAPKKKWTLDLLQKTPPTISGQDLSFGIPSVIDINSGDNDRRDDRNTAAWMQGWSPTGSDPMVRHSVGLIGAGYRFVVVNMGHMPSTTSNSDANRISTQVEEELIRGSGNENSGGGGGITLGGSDDTNNSKEIQDFIESQEKYM